MLKPGALLVAEAQLPAPVSARMPTARIGHLHSNTLKRCQLICKVLCRSLGFSYSSAFSVVKRHAQLQKYLSDQRNNPPVSTTTAIAGLLLHADPDCCILT